MRPKSKAELAAEIKTLQARIHNLEAGVAPQGDTPPAPHLLEQEFRVFVEHCPDVVARFDSALQHSYVNPAIQAMTGFPPQAVIGKTHRELGMPQDLAERWEAALRRVFETGQELCIECEYPSPDGPRHYEWRLFPERAQEGTIAAVFSIARDVTDRKRIEEALREGGLRFRSLWEHSMDGILLTAPAGRGLMANPAACQILGRSEEEICRIGRAGLVDPTDPRLSLLLEARTRSGACRGELRFVRPDGTTCPCEVTSTNLTSWDGIPLTTLSIRDMTEQKRANEDLCESEATARARADELATVLAATPALTFIAHDPDCHHMSSSRTALRLLRLPADANTSKSAPPGERPETFRVMKDGRELQAEELPVQLAAATGQPVKNFEFTFAFDDDTARDIVGDAVPLFDKDGKVRGAVGAFLDITERKQAEEQLRIASIYARSLIEASLDPLVTIDAAGRITDVNAATEEATGVARQQLIGSDFAEYFTDPDKARAGYRQVFDHGRVIDYPLTIRHTSGRCMDVLYNASVYRNEQGKVAGVFAAARDVTRQKRAEEALRRSQAELKAIYDNAPIMICVLNASRQVLYANRAFTEFVGRPLEELALGRAGGVIGCLNALDDPRGCEYGPRCETCAMRLAMVDAVTTGRTHRGIEYRITALRDGQPRDSVFLASVTPYEVLGKLNLLVCLEDITERQWAEEVFRDLSRFNQKILDALPANICVLDEDGKIVGTNRAWHDFAAANPPLSTAADIGADYFAVYDAVTGDNALMAREAVGGLRAVERGEVPEFSFEYPCHSPDTRRWFLLRATRLSDVSRPRIVIAHIDITERKQGEIALRAAEERYRAVLEDQTEAICRYLADGKFTYVNDAFCSLFGKTEQELYGQRWQPKVVPDDLPLIEAKLYTLSPANPVVVIENRIYSGRGEIHWMQFVNRGFFDSDGRLLEIQAVGRDITDRKQAEESLLTHTRQIEAVRTIGEEISRELDLAILLQIIAERSAELMGAASGVVALWDEAAQILVPRAWFGPGERIKALRWKPGEDNPGMTEAATHAAALVAPLLFDDRLVGVIRIDRAADQQPFTEMDRQLLALFATQAAITIENARLYAGVVRRSEETASLLRASRSLMAGLDLQETLSRIADEASRIARSQHAIVLLRDREKQTLRLGAVVGRPPALLDKFARGSRESLSAIVASTGQPLFVADCAHDPRNPYADEDRALGIVTYLGLPIAIHGEVVGVLTVNTTQPREYTSEDLDCLVSFANLGAIAIENARLFEEVRAGRERLQTLSRRQLELQESERRTLARELHDEIGQLLTGLKLTLDMVAGEASDTGQSLLRESQDLVGELIGHVRELSLNLRPALLDDLGLLPALLWQFGRYTTRTQIQVDFQHVGLDRRPCSPDVETAAYRIVQEALTNVARHAEVRKVQVRLRVEGKTLHLRIEDQGCGFEPTITLGTEESSGLAGMYERAKLLGGTLRIESSPGAGTRIQAELPLGEPERSIEPQSAQSTQRRTG